MKRFYTLPQQLFAKLRIARKISLGTFVAIGISVSGTLLGLWIGDNQQQRAQKQLAIASQKESLLRDLDTHILRLRAHPQKLVAAIENPLWFRYEVGQFETDLQTTQNLQLDIQAFVEAYSTTEEQTLLSAQSVERVLQRYEEILQEYAARFEQIWPQINPLKLNAEGRVQAQKTVLTTVLEEEGRELDVRFERLATQLEQLLQESESLKEAANQQVFAAARLRSQIIIGSLVTSLILAALLSIYTARAIATPLEQVTTVARKATEKSDYTLQVPVTTQDEVGSLARSINQLIQQVQRQLQELESARYSLEERVTERTQELERTLNSLQEAQSQLIQTEKMSSLGEMVAGIAHEINNPVSFIHGNVSHGQDYLKDLLGLIELYEAHYPNPSETIADYAEEVDVAYLKEDFPTLFESMQMGTKRITEIVKSLRNFSRLDEAEVKDVDIHEGLESTLLILGSKIKQGVEVIREYSDIPLIYCYPSQLNQVFLNIISNGIDALMSSERESKQITIITETMGSEYIQVRIRDNGPGIPPEAKAKIFNPFFTTKPIGAGTGLGLSISYRIIEKHQGNLTVESELGQGTEFRIALPIRSQAIAPLTT